MKKWRAILFDLDDTLYSERAYVSSGFRAVAAWAGPRSGVAVERGQAEMDALFDGGAKRDTFDQWFAEHGLRGKDLVIEALAVYRAHVPQIVPYSETMSLLNHLRKNYRLGIVSDGYLDVQRRKLEALGLAACFDTVVFSDELGRDAWKPSPLPFQLALERLEVAPIEAVYVGDNPRKDFVGARRAGIASIWLKVAGGMYSDLALSHQEEDADFSANSYSELERIFQDNLLRS